MTETTQPPRDPLRRRPGGRSARVQAAVLAAVVEELLAVGFGHLSFESVAARAGVHRTTVYRRWATREALVADALLTQRHREVPMPDTGSVQADLRLLAGAVAADVVSPVGAGLLRTAVAGAGLVPEMTSAAQQFWNTRLALSGSLVMRAIERGELPPGTDPHLLIEVLVAPLYLRLLVTCAPVTDAYVDRLVRLVVAGARAGAAGSDSAR